MTYLLLYFLKLLISFVIVTGINKISIRCIHFKSCRLYHVVISYNLYELKNISATPK